MSSNYPPGVTGNEPMIAGPLAEVVIDRECEAQTDDAGTECGFYGEVDVVIFGDGYQQWACPECGNEVVEEAPHQ